MHCFGKIWDSHSKNPSSYTPSHPASRRELHHTFALSLYQFVHIAVRRELNFSTVAFLQLLYYVHLHKCSLHCIHYASCIALAVNTFHRNIKSHMKHTVHENVFGSVILRMEWVQCRSYSSHKIVINFHIDHTELLLYQSNNFVQTFIKVIVPFKFFRRKVFGTHQDCT